MSSFGSNLRHIVDVVFISALNWLFVRQYVLMRCVLSSSQIISNSVQTQRNCTQGNGAFHLGAGSYNFQGRFDFHHPGIRWRVWNVLRPRYGLLLSLASNFARPVELWTAHLKQRSIIMGKASKLTQGDLKFVLSFPGRFFIRGHMTQKCWVSVQSSMHLP